MRILVKASMPVEAANAVIKSGKIGQVMQSILADLKPEAAYFAEENGKRTAYIFCHIQDPSEVPAVAEPFFLALNAHVEISPAMTAEDLAKAGPAIEQAVKKYAR